MALVLKDRVKETSTTTGTGTLTLGGAVTDYQAFSSAIGNGNTTYYAIDSGTEWEVGLGTVGAGTLSRDTILASSNSGSAVNFGAGQKTVWCDYPAGKAIYKDANGNISNLAGSISTADYIAFNTAYATTLSAGQLGWDGNDTLGLGMIGGNVIQHIGEDQFFYTKATSAITKGQVVMFTGAVGASGVPTGAPATGITDGSYIMGIAAESIALNGFGLIQTFGTLKNVNTTGYADGDILWYDPSVTGGLTKTKPSAPNVKAQMAAVINGGSSGGGTILIRINAGSTLGGTDSNAQITSPSNGQILTYDGTNTYWKNTTLTAGTGITTTPSSTGVITVTNTAPDQTVVLTAGTGISTSGTYPNFTITNTSPSSGGTVTSVSGTSPISVANGTTTPAITISQASGSTNGYLSSTDWTTFNNKGSGTVTSVAATAGTGISVTGSPITSSGTLTITNTAPDQTVSLTAGTGISVTGTYPSFTVTNTGLAAYPGAGIPNSTGSAWGTSYTTSGSGTVVALATGATLTNPSAVGTLTEDVYTITDGAGFAIDPTNGSIQLITLGANRTPTQANWSAGQGVTLMVDDGTAYTITWTTIGVTWVGGSAPTLATTGYTIIELWKVGTTIYGALVGSA